MDFYSIETTFAKYWYFAIFLMILYVIIILLIELKENSFANTRLTYYKHKYRKHEDWEKFNHQFLEAFYFYNGLPPEKITKEIQDLLLKLLESNHLKNGVSNENFSVDSIKITNQELKVFLEDSRSWFYQYNRPKNKFLLNKIIKTRKSEYKILLENLLRVENEFFKEFESEFLELNLNFGVNQG